MIRFAGLEDIPELIRRQTKVSESLPHPEGIGFSPDDAAASLEMAIRHSDADVIMGDRGVIGLALDRVWFDRPVVIAKAFFFWGGDGRRLVDAACEWGRVKGASRLRVDAQEYRAKATARVYRRYGLLPVERVYERLI